MSSPGDNAIKAVASQIEGLDAEIEQLQTDKRELYAAVREAHGKTVATALKNALRIKRMDADKKARAEEVDAETFRILNILSGSGTPVATRVARGAHEQLDHDPQTGEVNEIPSESNQDKTGITALGAAPDGVASRPSRGGGTPAPHSTGPVEMPDLPSYLDRRPKPA